MKHGIHVNVLRLILKALRKFYGKLFAVPKKDAMHHISENGAHEGSKILYEYLSSDKPVMVARFGATELSCIVNYLGVNNNNRSLVDFITGKSERWWWEDSILAQMQEWSGFFPPTVEKIEQFCDLMLEDRYDVDVLGTWLENERYVVDEMNVKKVFLLLLEPFYVEEPWTTVLEGKRVLVVHPFKNTILRQYEKRDLLFQNKNVLPEFASLNVVRAVQSLGKADSRFSDWFEALEFMKDEIDQHEYDVCLIGAGAYGFPLAAHVKRQGRKAVHLGGALQLLFGIRGTRWENQEYGKDVGVPYGFYNELMNEHWVRPDETEKPLNAQNVEGSSYW